MISLKEFKQNTSKHIPMYHAVDRMELCNSIAELFSRIDTTMDPILYFCQTYMRFGSNLCLPIECHASEYADYRDKYNSNQWQIELRYKTALHKCTGYAYFDRDQTCDKLFKTYRECADYCQHRNNIYFTSKNMVISYNAIYKYLKIVSKNGLLR